MSPVRITIVSSSLVTPEVAERLRVQLSSSSTFAQVRLESLEDQEVIFSAVDALPSPQAASSRMFCNDFVRHAAQLSRVPLHRVRIDTLALVS